MKIITKFFITLIGFITVAGISVNSYALDCNDPMVAVYCTTQPTKLKSSPPTYSEVFNLSPNPCCLQNCTGDAQYRNGNCGCRVGYHANGGTTECKKCPDTHPDSTFGAASESDCLNTCVGVIGTVPGGKKIGDNSAKKYNNPCNYTLVCDENYYKSGSECKACASGYTSPAGSTNQNQCKKECPACTLGANVASCAPSIKTEVSEPANCSYTATCKTGYHLRAGTENTPTPICDGNAYTLVFNTNGGTPAVANKSCTYGTACNFGSISLSKSSAAFIGWSKAANYNIPFIASGAQSMPAAWPPGDGTDVHYPAVPSTNGATVTLYAAWQKCSNTGTDNAQAWTGDCVITACKPGYYLGADGVIPGGTTPRTACLACTTANNAGNYCPGGNECPNGICPCKQGYYCPGDQVKATECPGGTTTDTTTSTSEGDCFVKGGSAGTKFCDSTGQCFYIPGNVPLN